MEEETLSSSSISEEACQHLLGCLSQMTPPSEPTIAPGLAIAIDWLRKASSGPYAQDHIKEALVEIAFFLSHAIDDKDPSAAPILELFANATRVVPFWRSQFGVLERSTEEQNLEQMSESDIPDCVLEVARRVLNRQTGDKWSDNPLLRSALRIVANCCADNNINRALIIHRGGIEDIFKIITSAPEIEIDFAIAAMYNVCVEFDEPALDESGAPISFEAQMQNTPHADSELPVSLAEQYIGRWRAEETAAQALLAVHETCARQYWPILAELIDMSTRAAIVGVQNIFDTAEDLKLSGRCHRFLGAMSKIGLTFACRGAPVRSFICQSLLNVLTQSQVREILVEADNDYIHLLFLRLPYVRNNNRIDEGVLRPCQEAFLKLTYELAALGQLFNPFSDYLGLISTAVEEVKICSNYLVHQTPDAYQWREPSLLATVFVLLASVATTEEKTKMLLEMDIHSPIKVFLALYPADQSAFPALNLANRLALCEAGRVKLQEADIFHSLYGRLSMTGRTTAVQLQCIQLVTVMITANSLRAGHLLASGLLPVILDTFKYLSDTTIKTQVGQLVKELCKTMMSADRAGQLTGPLQKLFRGENLSVAKLLTEPMCFMITDGKTPELIGQGWLSLAILSSVPQRGPLVLEVFSRGKILDALDEVVSSGQGPNYNNLKVALANLVQNTPSDNLPSRIMDAAKTVGVA